MSDQTNDFISDLNNEVKTASANKEWIERTIKEIDDWLRVDCTTMDSPAAIEERLDGVERCQRHHAELLRKLLEAQEITD